MARSGFDTFGFVSSLIALLGSVFGVIYFSLPARRQKCLDELLQETEEMWRTAVEEGLLIDSSFTRTTEQSLTNLHIEADDLRTQTYGATTLYHQVKGTITGLSFKIVYLCRQVKDLRAMILTTTTQERKRLQNEGHYNPLESRRIVRPAGDTANPRNPFDEAAHSSTESALHNDSSDNTCYSSRSEPSVASTADVSVALEDLDNEDSGSRHAPSATANVGEVPIHALEKDSGAVHPPLCTNSGLGEDGAQHQYPSRTDSALEKNLHQVYIDLSIKDHNYPLRSAATEYARARRTMDFEPLVRQCEGDASILPSENLEMQMIEDCV